MHANERRSRQRAAHTLFEKIWNGHEIANFGRGVSLIHVDRHVLHEVSSARAFANMAKKGRRVRNPELTFATLDHIVSTTNGRSVGSFPEGRELLERLQENCVRHGIRLFGLADPRQGIVHVMSAERAIALPGSTLVCGDSHTSTVGALGALAWGVGTSDVEHVLATQTIVRKRPKSMRVSFQGTLAPEVAAKDLILYLIGQLGTDGAAGHVVEYAGPVIDSLPIEARLTICNMSVELGARAGLVAPDERTFDYLKGREFAPRFRQWDAAVQSWRTLCTDPDARFDREVAVDCTAIRPQVTWGTNPQHVIAIDDWIPDPDQMEDTSRRQAARRALDYMGLLPGKPIEGLKVDVVFIGSCTNGRLSDLQEAARIVEGRKVAPGVRALVVAGSRAVREEAQARGVDRIFVEAGFEWRESGCSMCVSINDDRVLPGQRCVSTSNRNFEGRQGPGSRTHLASPATAAASAIAGAIADHRKLPG